MKRRILTSALAGIFIASLTYALLPEAGLTPHLVVAGVLAVLAGLGGGIRRGTVHRHQR